MTLWKPLEQLSSIKTKISIVIVTAIAATVVVSEIGSRLGIETLAKYAIAVVFALAMTFYLSRGLTRPLRKMVAVSKALAAGDYSQRVNTSRNDEVGQLAHAFDAMADTLEATDRLQKDFVANAAHELRTPVTSLRLAIENLADGVEKADPETLAALVHQAERLSSLASQLLDLSHLEASANQKLTYERFEFLPLCQDLFFELSHSTADIHFIASIEKDLFLEANQMQLEQAIRNLLTNAVRFSPTDGTIKVAARQAGNLLHIEILDQGSGIAAEHKAQIFERFWRADNTSQITDEGAGLGLAITKQIVHNHGGQITVEDNKPNGCCFKIVLPSSQSFSDP